MSTPFETSANLAALPSVIHGFFGRSSGSDDDFNLSENFGTADSVAQNYTAALTALGTPNARLARLKQTHSNRVITITADSDLSHRPDADGLVTDQPNIALTILTADCTPLLFADPDANIVGACHAGWKGAVSGVIANTIAAMQNLGANPSNIMAAIGPTITAPNYEVGPEFTANLVEREPLAHTFFSIPDGKTREHFDLPGYAAFQATRTGVKSLEKTGDCTFAQADQYFSHRHASANLSAHGRQAAFISLTK